MANDDGIVVTDLDYNICHHLDLDYEAFSITRDQAESSLETLIQHITYVREAGEKLAVPRIQLAYHDQTKFSLEEFPYYVRQFKGDQGDPTSFAKAWLHHLHFNSHHPEHYRFFGGFCPKGADVVGGCMQMPQKYILEHVSDLMGASKVHQGSWDMADWLSKNMGRMYYHPATAQIMRVELSKLGYTDIVYAQKFGHELEREKNEKRRS